MKRIILLLLLTVTVVSATGSNSENFRRFTSKDGQEIEARIVEYDFRKGKLQIERRNKKTIWVAPEAFAESDQAHIKEWIAADTFSSPKALGVSLQLKEKTRFNEYKSVKYELVFNNKTAVPIKIHNIDVLYKVDRKEHKGAKNKIEWAYRESLHPYTVKLGKCTHMLPRSLYLDEGDHDEEIRGVWVRLRGPALGEKELYREVRLPEQLRVKSSWMEMKKIASIELLNPYRPKKVESARTAGAKPADEQEYRKWFNEINKEGEYYVRINPAQIAEAKKFYAELKEFYDPQYETERGSYAFRIAMLAYMVRDYKGAVEWYETSLSAGGTDSTRTKLCALYSSGISGVTDGRKALVLAKTLVAEDEESVTYQDLLARAYARAGQFDMAIEAQKKVIKLMKERTKPKYQKSNLKQYRDRLELYEKGKPYYDRPPDGWS